MNSNSSLQNYVNFAVTSHIHFKYLWYLGLLFDTYIRTIYDTYIFMVLGKWRWRCLALNSSGSKFQDYEIEIFWVISKYFRGIIHQMELLKFQVDSIWKTIWNELLINLGINDTITT